jgi:hypothetical protein
VKLPNKWQKYHILGRIFDRYLLSVEPSHKLLKTRCFAGVSIASILKASSLSGKIETPLGISWTTP